MKSVREKNTTSRRVAVSLLPLDCTVSRKLQIFVDCLVEPNQTLKCVANPSSNGPSPPPSFSPSSHQQTNLSPPPPPPPPPPNSARHFSSFLSCHLFLVQRRPTDQVLSLYETRTKVDNGRRPRNKTTPGSSFFSLARFLLQYP